MGLPPEHVAIETMLAGGSFGRRAQPTSDLAAEAAAALKALGREASIKLVWTREDDIRGGRYRPFVVHRIRRGSTRAATSSAGTKRSSASRSSKGSPFEMMMKDGIDPTMVEGASDLPYAIPNFRVSAHMMEVGVPTLWWRSVGHTHTAYATETIHRRAARRRRQGSGAGPARAVEGAAAPRRRAARGRASSEVERREGRPGSRARRRRAQIVRQLRRADRRSLARH